MIRFFVGLMLVIGATGAIDTPVELMKPDFNTTASWTLFTILNAIGLPCMMWGILGMQGKG